MSHYTCDQCGLPTHPSSDSAWHWGDDCGDLEKPCPSWGRWFFKESSLVLTNSEYWYEIDLERITSSASMLDWIFQLHGKAWHTPQDTYDLLTALHDIFQPQSTMCSCGKERSSKEILAKRLKTWQDKRKTSTAGEHKA